MFSSEKIFDLSIPFKEKTIQTFEFQRKHNPIYKTFCETLGISEVKSINEIPLLPIEAFKEVKVITSHNSQITNDQSQFFQSSGTSGMKRSRHYLLGPEIYRESVLQGMQNFYNLNNFVIWAYTPGYAENPH